MALVALAINFVLCLGHVHAIDAHGHERHSNGLIAALASHHADQQQDHSDGHADDLCPICLAAAAIATGLAPTLPVLAVDFAVTPIDRTIEPLVTIAELQASAFQPRGPPIS
jgi:hypothetical protein